MDKNIVILEGTIGEGFKYDKSELGWEFATFPLLLDSYIKAYADKTEATHRTTTIRIFCYDKRQVAYLKKVGAHRGNRVSIFGRLWSSIREYKGIEYSSNSVVCRDIHIVKTKADKETTEETSTKEQQ